MCFFGKHHWLKSKSLNANLICVICEKKTKHFKDYERLKR